MSKEQPSPFLWLVQIPERLSQWVGRRASSDLTADNRAGSSSVSLESHDSIGRKRKLAPSTPASPIIGRTRKKVNWNVVRGLSTMPPRLAPRRSFQAASLGQVKSVTSKRSTSSIVHGHVPVSDSNFPRQEPAAAGLIDDPLTEESNEDRGASEGFSHHLLDSDDSFAANDATTLQRDELLSFSRTSKRLAATKVCRSVTSDGTHERNLDAGERSDLETPDLSNVVPLLSMQVEYYYDQILGGTNDLAGDWEKGEVR
jgi:hypothetical protein